MNVIAGSAATKQSALPAKILKPMQIFNVLHAASLDEINDIEGFGDIVAQSVYEYFHDAHSQRFFEKLEKAGVQILPEISQKRTPLSGKKVVITGSLKGMGRQEAKDAVKKAGGISQSDVSAKTDYLVVGEEPGSKLAKAKKLGVKIIDEDEFARLLK